MNGAAQERQRTVAERVDDVIEVVAHIDKQCVDTFAAHGKQLTAHAEILKELLAEKTRATERALAYQRLPLWQRLHRLLTAGA